MIQAPPPVRARAVASTSVIGFPPPAPGSPVKVSATLYTTYRRCPAQALARQEHVYPRETPAMFLGALAHRLFRRHLESGPIVDVEAACREEIGVALNGAMVSAGVRRPSELAPLVARAGELYRRFRALDMEGVEGAEVRLEAEPVAGVTLLGSVDAVFRREGPVLVDWKTGGLGDAEGQLSFYGLLWALARDELPAGVEAVSLGTGEREVVSVGPDDLARTAADVSAMVSVLRRAGEGTPVEARGGPWCRSCPAVETCAEGTRIVELVR